MMAPSNPVRPPVSLKPPGAGIPRVHKLVARWIMLPMQQRRTPWEAIPGALESQGREIQAVASRAAGPGGSRWSTPALVRPLPGLEDHSRFYSPAMVLEHLAKVNTRMVEVVAALSTGRPVPAGPSAIVDFKPSPGAGPDAAGACAAALADLVRVLRGVTPEGRRSRGTTVHPWFGPLTLAQWAPFTVMHQAIHLRQLKEIERALSL